MEFDIWVYPVKKVYPGTSLVETDVRSFVRTYELKNVICSRLVQWRHVERVVQRFPECIGRNDAGKQVGGDIIERQKILSRWFHCCRTSAFERGAVGSQLNRQDRVMIRPSEWARFPSYSRTRRNCPFRIHFPILTTFSIRRKIRAICRFILPEM